MGKIRPPKKGNRIPVVGAGFWTYTGHQSKNYFSPDDGPRRPEPRRSPEQLLRRVQLSQANPGVFNQVLLFGVTIGPRMNELAVFLDRFLTVV